ncbi:hypothetical protein EBU99_08055 [bacterium]|nr:hypothetical protein [bacterium]
MVVILLEILGFLLSALGARGRSLVAWSLAFVAFDLLHLRRKLVLRNLERAYGRDSSPVVRAQVGRAALANFILTTLEFFSSRRVYPQQKVVFRNGEIFQNALAQGRGVYLMVIHMGNFELMADAILKQFAVPVHTPVKPVGKGALARWVKAQRAAHGLLEIANDGASSLSRTKRIFEGLELKQCVGFVVDQRRSKGLLAPFFGEMAWTNAGLFYLWKQRPAPIIPMTIKRVGENQHEVTVHEEFVVEQDSQWSHDQYLLENTKRMNGLVEILITANPQEYFWMHDRWKK